MKILIYRTLDSPFWSDFTQKCHENSFFFYYFQNRTKNTGFPRVRKNNSLGKKENLQCLKTFLPDTGWNETAALWKNPIEFHTFKKPNPRRDFCEKYFIIKLRFCFILQLMHEGPCHVEIFYIKKAYFIIIRPRPPSIHQDEFSIYPIFNTDVWFSLLWLISGLKRK